MTVRIGLLVVLVIVLISNEVGCASRREAKARANAPDLLLAKPREDTIHCARGDCVNLYRLVVEQRRRVSIQADAPADPRLPDFSLVLEDRDGNVIADDRKANQRPRRVVETLEPGLYFVRIEGQDKKDDRLSYKIVVVPAYSRRTAPTRASKPKPTPAAAPEVVVIESEVLEIERAGGEPVAVLIEAGTAEGISPGQKGELVEGDDVIGRFEIVDVYAAGSRARILGGLKTPITLDTRARVQK